MVEVLGISTKTTELLQQVPRRSRRLARLPPTPLEIPMSHSGDQQPSLAAPVRTTGTWMHQMEPRPFSGKLGEDVEEWLTHYKRVSKYNGWNSTAQLDNVGLFLTDTALVWFENHEDSFTTWDSFVIDLTECFGDSTTKRKRAEQTLLQRAQVPGETCTTYIEAILKLCKTVNPRMSEEDKVGHLLKGIAEDVYNYLIGKESLASVADLIKHCRTFEALKLRRITPKFGRLANVTTVASVDDNDKCNFQFDLVATIRQIVREELERHPTGANVEQLRCACNQPQEHASAVSALSAMPGVADCRVDQLRQHRRSSPDDMTHDQRTRRATTTNRHSADRVYYSQRPRVDPEAYNVGRASPVCYSCGASGHIARFCRRRRQTTTYGPPPAWPNFEQVSYDDRWPTDPDTANTTGAPPRNTFRQYNRRSGSPASDRSLTPPTSRQRRSPSPRRRATSPPPSGN